MGLPARETPDATRRAPSAGGRAGPVEGCRQLKVYYSVMLDPRPVADPPAGASLFDVLCVAVLTAVLLWGASAIEGVARTAAPVSPAPQGVAH